MFIKNKSDVDVYTRKIYAYLIHTKSKEYVEFVQKLLKNKIEDAINIVIADIHDYFDQFDKQHEYYEETRLEEIDEKIYMLDDAFTRYAYSMFIIHSSCTNDINLIYLIKSILLSIKDVIPNLM